MTTEQNNNKKYNSSNAVGFLGHLKEYVSSNLISPARVIDSATSISSSTQSKTMNGITNNLSDFQNEIHLPVGFTMSGISNLVDRVKSNNSLFSMTWDVFDFVLGTYRVVLIRGIQQSIADAISDQAHVILQWVVGKTTNVLQLSRNFMFLLVVALLTIKFVREPPRSVLLGTGNINTSSNFGNSRNNNNLVTTVQGSQNQGQLLTLTDANDIAMKNQQLNFSRGIFFIPINPEQMPTSFFPAAMNQQYRQQQQPQMNSTQQQENFNKVIVSDGGQI